jgi:S1-C subfamily serine protease
MFLSHRIVLVVTLFVAAPMLALQLPQAAAQLSGEEITERVAPAVVLILVGQGGEQPTGVASGVILRADGTLFTAYHVVKDALQVQVRLQNGEIYDEAELVGFDQRRDVAALRIAAAGLPALAVAPLSEAKPGETVYVISNPRGLGWSVSSGVLSGVRLADEVPGAGSGYRVLQFTAPISPGSSGGVVVNGRGQALGIVVGSEAGGQNLNFAVPIESVVGLAEGTVRVRLGSARALAPFGGPELRRRPAEPSASEMAAPAARAAGEPPRKLYLEYKQETGALSKTTAALESELIRHPDFESMGLAITRNRGQADLIIELDRSWWDFTFSILDPRSGAVVGAGKEIAWDEIRAARGLAKKIMSRLKAHYGSPGEDKPRKKD